MNLADNLKRIRKEHNLSQEQLADKLNVSRQAVSKWESGQAYPEMDKMLQLCQIFNLNIDELLNQNIKDVNSKKEAKNNVNKFVDSFLEYITKTVNMFSSMKAKVKFKCIFEQLLIISVLILIFLIVGSIFGVVINNFIKIIPYYLSNVISSVLQGIYILFCLVIGIIIVLNIFKVRYLDYYIIVNENEVLDNSSDEKLDDIKKEVKVSKPVLEKKQEKIIIRDESHSGYKFMSGLLKVVLWFIKLFAFLTAIFFSLLLIVLVFVLVISFLFVKTKLIFLGLLLVILACIAINIVILINLYNFIRSIKIRGKVLAVVFIVSIVTIGIGFALAAIGISKLNYIDDMSTEYFISEEAEIDMTDDLTIFDPFYNIHYVEADNKNIKIKSTHSKYYKLHVGKDKNHAIIYNTYLNGTQRDIIDAVIDDINSGKVVNYYKNEITIYTTRENIDKLKKNSSDYEQEQNEINRQISDYEDTIRSLEEKLIEKENTIYELQQSIAELKTNYYE